MDSAQISGKVFRFLSAMHPSLSKSERKRYAGFDPDQWYPWTAEVASEFTDLMRRSPRDTSFARGFAYAAEKALPDGQYVPADQLVANLGALPAAYQGPGGSGFEVESEGDRKAAVVYRGMPGFTNVCIAVTGELEQRLKDAGARGVEVRHGKLCRLHGGDACQFEVSWGDESEPAGATAVDAKEFAGLAPASGSGPEAADSSRSSSAATPEPAGPAPAAKPLKSKPKPKPPRREPRAAPVEPSESSDAGSAEDLFSQLKGKLEEAERQARLHAELEAEIENLNSELDEVRAEAERSVAAANAETERVRGELDNLKLKIREIVGSD